MCENVGIVRVFNGLRKVLKLLSFEWEWKKVGMVRVFVMVCEKVGIVRVFVRVCLER